MLTAILQDEAALWALKDEWQALSTAVPSSLGFFGSWDVVWHTVKVIRPDKWFVVTIRAPETQKLVAVFAWELVNLQTPARTYRAVQPLGAILGPYIEFSMEPRQLRPVLQVLLNTVLAGQAHIDVVCLWPLHEASPLFNTLTEDMRGSDLLKTFRYPGNLREIETRGLDYAQYGRSKSTITFANARYGERRLNRQGAMRFTLCEPMPVASDVVANLCSALIERFGDQFAYRAKPGWQAWVVALVQGLADAGVAQVSTLRFNEQIIASGLSFWHKGRRYFYLTHYDPAYARYSPGKILLYRLIEQTFADRGVFCFGPGTYSYKEDWAQSTGELKAAFIFLNPQARQTLDGVVDRGFIGRSGVA